MKRYTLKAAALTAVAALTLAACGGGSDTPSTAASGSAGAAAGSIPLTLGVLQEPASWDPAQAHVGHQLQPFQVPYDTLILRNPDGAYAPMLATEWGYTDDTNLVFQLKLRESVTFSDGTPFDAEAVKANLEHFAADNGKQAAQVAAVESVTVVDPTTVEVNLKQQDPAFEYYMSQAAGLMGSPKSLGTDEMDRVPVGTGPYVMVEGESVVGSQYVFTPREGYWDPALQKFNKITLKLLADGTSRVNALQSGEVDATLIDAAGVSQADSSGKAKLQYPVDWQGLLLFDRDGKVSEPLADVKVRQAINHAFNRQALLDALSGGFGKPTSQVFGPESGAWLPELEDRYPYDPEKAKALLAEAGYASGVEIEMPVVGGISDTIMTAVTQQLADVGITVNLTSVPIADYQGELGAGKFPAAWFSLFQGVPWVAINQMITPTALYNPFQTTNSEIEGLITAVRDGGAQSDANAQEVNKYVTENAWFAPWFRPDQLYFYDAAKITVTPQIQMAVPAIYNYAPAS
ncbi:MAG: ABC transporter substrate-binding protein [Candidatus Nanopelagicales bacterium]